MNIRRLLGQIVLRSKLNFQYIVNPAAVTRDTGVECNFSVAAVVDGRDTN